MIKLLTVGLTVFCSSFTCAQNSPKAKQDIAFMQGSKVDTVLLNDRQVQNLNLLGQVWGFLKYHHPASAAGDINMDAELFRTLPQVLAAVDDRALNVALEQWIDRLGTPPPCAKCKPYSGKDIAHSPDYGALFNPGVLNEAVTAKLNSIRQSYQGTNSYYVGKGESGNPVFLHEEAYRNMQYPDAGYRLLSLFRYWNMVQYFYPDKHLIGEEWSAVLPRFIPRFVQAANKNEYTLAALELIASIHDSHAKIDNNPVLEEIRGAYALPFRATFIEDKLTVTGYYADTLDVKNKFKPGDVITAINGTGVGDLIQKYLPITVASNYATQLRDMPSEFLLRSNNRLFTLEVEGRGSVSINAIEAGKATSNLVNSQPGGRGFKLLNDQVGYVFPANYKNSDLPEIKKLFAGTKGIIVDMRCYPPIYILSTFIPYIKTGNASSVKHTRVTNPGLFVKMDGFNVPGKSNYKGKVVVIVNEGTQSTAEYITMAFQSSRNVQVIGSTTAGADGNVSAITLPGGILTRISGTGVLYPDGTETQRKGVKIDLVIKPTVTGIKAGRDELLEKAKELILTQ